MGRMGWVVNGPWHESMSTTWAGAMMTHDKGGGEREVRLVASQDESTKFRLV